VKRVSEESKKIFNFLSDKIRVEIRLEDQSEDQKFGYKNLDDKINFLAMS
jgi:hypothetical protein